MRNTADVTGGKPIAVFLQSISGVSAINPLAAFYDIHGGKGEVLFFNFVPDTTRDLCSWKKSSTKSKVYSRMCCWLYVCYWKRALCTYLEPIIESSRSRGSPFLFKSANVKWQLLFPCREVDTESFARNGNWNKIVCSISNELFESRTRHYAFVNFHSINGTNREFAWYRSEN
jgi:hypothetical protein